MNIVIFYKKPGCVTNAKQKQSLRRAGCTVIERNLLKHDMNEKDLLGFFEGKPVHEWFNPNAPKIKEGKLDPYSISKEEAIESLINEPILIRRPLLIAKNQKILGFSQEYLEKLLNVKLERNITFASTPKNNLSPISAN